ncbi:hypothetical protein NIES2101_38775 [Calothrix sp. HK-06]|nr:hypothetical protein NIES2101_38775 [Calothrix sp. HK-06]
MDNSSQLTTNTLHSASSALPLNSGTLQDPIDNVKLNARASSTILVNNTADIVDANDGVTTLREAINKANADAGNDTIVFDSSIFSTDQKITLNLGDLDIIRSVNIIAPVDFNTGKQLLTVSGNNTSRVFEIESTAAVNLSGLIITDGNGSGIKNSGTVDLNNSIVRNNTATPNSAVAFGGGIYNLGTVRLNNSTITANTANAFPTNPSFPGFPTELATGGGIYNAGTLEVNNSTISDNLAINRLLLSGDQRQTGRGGGIFNTGKVTLKNSTISGNTSGDGGGIDNYGTVMIDSSTISDNRAVATRLIGRGTEINFGSGGGINSTGGTVTVNNSTLSRNFANFGGSISISSDGTLTVSNSTISGNNASLGGGIANGRSSPFGGAKGGIATVSNSTISFSNRADLGAGVWNSGTFTINNSALEYNISGGAIANFDGGFLNVSNSALNSNTGISGGGIINGIGSTAKVSASILNGNSASDSGGGIRNGGLLEVIQSILSYNLSATFGGGIDNRNGTAVVSDSTITGNRAISGGGIFGGILNASNSDISGNTSNDGKDIAA